MNDRRSSKLFKSLLLLFAVLFQVASNWDAKSIASTRPREQSNWNNSKDL